MNTPLAALDKELERRLKEIEELETDLFFKRLRLAGLKSVKDALLRELVVGNEGERERNGKEDIGGTGLAGRDGGR